MALSAARVAMGRAVTRESWQCEVAELDPAVAHRRLPHRATGGASPLGGAAGIEDLESVTFLVQRQVRVAEDHGVRIREAGPQALEAPPGRAGVMDYGEGRPAEVQRERLGELAPQLGAVDVAVHRSHRAQLAKLGEHRRVAEVAGVDDQVRAAQGIEAGLREAAAAARQMGVSDQGEPDGSLPARRSERSRLASIRSRSADLSARRRCWRSSSGVIEVSIASCSSVVRSCWTRRSSSAVGSRFGTRVRVMRGCSAGKAEQQSVRWRRPGSPLERSFRPALPALRAALADRLARLRERLPQPVAELARSVAGTSLAQLERLVARPLEVARESRREEGEHHEHDAEDDQGGDQHGASGPSRSPRSLTEIGHFFWAGSLTFRRGYTNIRSMPVACALIPRFQLIAAVVEPSSNGSFPAQNESLLSKRPHRTPSPLLRRPAALAPEPGAAQLIGEVSAPAERFGLRPGMRVGEALSRCPELVLIPPDLERAERSWDEALRRLEGIGAEVESGRAGEAFFEASGLSGLWGGIAGVLERARRELGSSTRLGAGPGRFCAYVAAVMRGRDARARRQAGPVLRGREEQPVLWPGIVPDGTAAEFLKPLPVSLL